MANYNSENFKGFIKKLLNVNNSTINEIISETRNIINENSNINSLETVEGTCSLTLDKKKIKNLKEKLILYGLKKTTIDFIIKNIQNNLCYQGNNEEEEGNNEDVEGNNEDLEEKNIRNYVKNNILIEENINHIRSPFCKKGDIILYYDKTYKGVFEVVENKTVSFSLFGKVPKYMFKYISPPLSNDLNQNTKRNKLAVNDFNNAIIIGNISKYNTIYKYNFVYPKKYTNIKLNNSDNLLTNFENNVSKEYPGYIKYYGKTNNNNNKKVETYQIYDIITDNVIGTATIDELVKINYDKYNLTKKYKSVLFIKTFMLNEKNLFNKTQFYSFLMECINLYANHLIFIYNKAAKKSQNNINNIIKNIKILRKTFINNLYGKYKRIISIKIISENLKNTLKSNDNALYKLLYTRSN